MSKSSAAEEAVLVSAGQVAVGESRRRRSLYVSFAAVADALYDPDVMQPHYAAAVLSTVSVFAAVVEIDVKT